MMIEKMRTPQYIFFVYMLAAGLVIMIFKFIFPGDAPPLVFYYRNWRFVQGALAFFNLFPALAFSALVIPFGLVSGYEERFQSFSEMFFKKMSVSVILAVFAAVVYGLIFFLALPSVKSLESNMIYSGDLYRTSRANMQEHRNRGEWKEALQYLQICERIWYNNEEIQEIKVEINRKIDEIRLQEFNKQQQARAALTTSHRSASMTTLSGNVQPTNAAESMSMAEAAFADQRYFDAHWLATLAGRLASPGSPEFTRSARLASDAWNEISSLAENQIEARQREIFELKIEGYTAMDSAGKIQDNKSKAASVEWIRAYYIFKRLSELSPDDPDVKNFLAKSEEGSKETAFFTDEMEIGFGEILTGAVFSLPIVNYEKYGEEEIVEDAGRAVLRFGSITTTDDIAYGKDLEFMSFDLESNLVTHVMARYAKISPLILNGLPHVIIIMHALDREDENTRYDSEYLYGEPSPGGLLINIAFEDLLLFKEVRKGLSNLQMGDLFEAAKIGGKAGYVHQIFQAEILNRLGSALFFLPMAIFVIVIGWRYRAMKRPRYLFAIMLPVLPVVFNGFVFLYRSVFNTLGIWLVLSMGFAGALTLYIVVLAVSIFATLIALAAQHT